MTCQARRAAIRGVRRNDALAGSPVEKRHDDATEAAEQYRVVVSLLDRAARKGVIPSNAADRSKSRLARYVSRLGD